MPTRLQRLKDNKNTPCGDEFKQRARFNAAFDRAANNITEPGERELIDELRRERGRYYGLVDSWLAAGGQADNQRAGYFNDLEPAFHQLRGRCEALLQLNQQAIIMLEL